MKTKAQICAEVFKEKGEHDFCDVGTPYIMMEMYYALKAAGFKGCKIEHPLNRLAYVSRCLAEDSHRINNIWVISGTITYPGICKRKCNVYKLKE
jgi:hypothetical protein